MSEIEIYKPDLPVIDTAYVIKTMRKIWLGSVNGMPIPKNNGYFYEMNFTNTSLALFKAGQYNEIKKIDIYL